MFSLIIVMSPISKITNEKNAISGPGPYLSDGWRASVRAGDRLKVKGKSRCERLRSR
jgi:hypothetical protein